MGPDESLPIIPGTGQVFFAPAGTELPGDGDLEAAGFTPLGFTEEVTFIDEAHEAMTCFGNALTKLVEVGAETMAQFVSAFSANHALLRMFWFGEHRPKAVRKRHDSLLIAERKQARADRRRAQREEIGIKSASLRADHRAAK